MRFLFSPGWLPITWGYCVLIMFALYMLLDRVNDDGWSRLNLWLRRVLLLLFLIVGYVVPFVLL